MLSSIVDAIGFLVKFHGANILPLVNDHLVPFAAGLLDDEHFPSVQTAGMCIMEDLIEHGGPAAAPLADPLVPYLLQGLGSPSPEQRQSAAFGSGVVAAVESEQVSRHASDFVQGLLEIVWDPEAREGANEVCTDNAVSSLIKFARFRAREAGVDAESIMSVVRGYLPVTADAIEARVVHAWMVDALGRGDPLLLGHDASHVPHVLQVIVHALLAHHAKTEDDPDEGIFRPEDLEALPAALEGLQKSAPDAVASVLRSFPPPVVALLNSPADPDAAAAAMQAEG